MAPLTTESMPTFLDRTVKKIETGLANRKKKALYPRIVKVESTKNKQEKIQDIESMDLPGLWPELSSRPSVTPNEGWPQSFTQHAWASKVLVTKAMQKFEQYDLIKRLTRMMMDGTYNAKEILAIFYYIYGDVALASVPTVGGSLPIVRSETPNSQTIFSESHAWRSGGSTLSNKTSSLLDLTTSGLATIYAQVMGWTDNAGQPLNCNLKNVMVPAEKMDEALKVFKTRRGEPSNADNAINIAPFITQDDIIMHPRLTDATDWYIFTDFEFGGILFKFGWEDEAKSDYVDENSNRHLTIDFSLAHGPMPMPLGCVKSTA